ncbi:RusA family crossover junction endodeoxyribonuclease [Streptococcus sciuri]|uniref:RusA family crossover junction endodeoxyribonuclease n=1 Tax=Streptococcus sciuri TaxID=2973939 RepID=A0ABT2F7D1_9STRE|nr:RusA family crossover junction endodeoxyribonuclease [Streptococcus sciuri]MCS4488395.1 RusA family crossover junction endodeoxyribonuclease [Streptococcus sciuri]
MIIIVPFKPKPQERARYSCRGGYAKAYESKPMRDWRNAVTRWFKKNYKGEFYESAVKVDVTFYMEAPLYLCKKPAKRALKKTWEQYYRFTEERIWHDKKVDIDNLVKSVFDSITKSGVVWLDDGLVSCVTARKLYSPKPRIELKIEVAGEV